MIWIFREYSIIIFKTSYPACLNDKSEQEKKNGYFVKPEACCYFDSLVLSTTLGPELTKSHNGLYTSSRINWLEKFGILTIILMMMISTGLSLKRIAIFLGLLGLLSYEEESLQSLHVNKSGVFCSLNSQGGMCLNSTHLGAN